MKKIVFIFLFITACTKEKPIDLTYKGPETGKCYLYEEEAIKIISILNGKYYYQHSWNDQDKIFNRDINYFLGKEIPCDKTGYEFEIISYLVKNIKKNNDYLDEKVRELEKEINKKSK